MMEAVKEKVELQRYPEYKDSGVEWLGEIPKHWILEKTKYLWEEKADLAKTEEHTLLSVSQYTGVGINKEDSRSDSLIGYKKVDENDLVINIMLAWLGGLGLSPYSGVVSPSYAVYKLVYDADSKFLHYLYRTKTYLAEFARKSTGVVPSRWRMYTDDFGQVLTLLPPKEEQTAITNFLDRKTEQIDQAIEIKQKQIELLKERRQILTHKAVTRGLNPDAPLKPSGVDWIGDIPKHWDQCSLKWLSQRYAGGTPDKSNLKYWQKGTIPWIASGEVNQEFIEKPTSYITEKALKNSSANWIPKDSLVVALAGQGKTKGTVAYLKIRTTGNQSLAAIIPNKDKVLPLFLFYYLKSSYNELRGVSGEGKRDGLNLTKLGDLEVCIPERHEQEEIFSYCKEVNNKTNHAISVKSAEIEKLKEYKSTLINSAVTGKIKVS